MNNGVNRNISASLAILGVSITCGFVGERLLENDALLKLLKDAWIVQAVLVTAVVALIYRLQSDLASLAGLKAAQRVKLDGLVKKKSQRLWLLFFLIAVSALLPRVAEVTWADLRVWLVFAATVLMVATALYCLYLPAMWNELRQFLTAMVAERELRERREKELERLTNK